MRLILKMLTAAALALAAGCSVVPTRPAEAPAPETAAAPEPAPEPPREPVAPELLFHYLAGELARQRGDVDTAVRHYLAAAHETEDVRMAEAATRLAIAARDADSALRAAQRWLELSPGNTDALRAAVVASVHAQRFDQAVTFVDQLIETGAERGQVFGFVGKLLGSVSDPDERMAFMDLLLQRYPDDPDVLLTYARVAMQAEDYETAERYTTFALERRPDWAEAQLLRARIRMARGDAEEALQGLAEAVASRPEDIDLRVAYARMLIEAKELALAREQFRAIYKAQPDNTDILYALALLEVEGGEWAPAREHFERLLAADKRTNEAHYYLGRIAENDGRYEEAVEHYDAVHGGEYLLDAQLRYASALARSGKLEEAREHLRGLRLRNPQMAVRFYVAEGQILSDAGQPQAAFDLYTAALEEVPGDIDLLYRRALVAEQLDRLDVAEADLRAILEEDPDNAFALNALGYTLADRTERYDEALGYIRRALELRPDDAAVIDSMGWILYRMGDTEQALQYLQKAHALNNDGEIAAHLVEVLWKLGRTQEAREVFEKAIADNPDHPKLLEVGHWFQR